MNKIVLMIQRCFPSDLLKQDLGNTRDHRYLIIFVSPQVSIKF